jgi:hypothetical protein
MAFHRNALQEQLGSVTQFAVHNPRRRCVRMRLDFVCTEDVQHFHPARFEVIRDKRAMATPPNCFGAHDCGRACFRSNVEQSLDSFLELLRLHVIGVPAERRVTPRSVARVWLGFSFAAQLREMFVMDSVPVQRFFQSVLVELWVTLRAWERAHIDQQLGLVFFEQRNEVIDRPCRVSDGPDSHDSIIRRGFTPIRLPYNPESRTISA